MFRFLSMLIVVLILAFTLLLGCGGSDDVAYATLHNDFDNPEMSYNPPWTVCQSNYLGVDFGSIDIGKTSAELEVTPGLDYVLMVLAWDDPDCKPENCLPVASKNEEEIVTDQHRTISINLANHKGPCPPEGVEPISEELYNRILKLYPEYNFKEYASRTDNTQCLD